MMLSRISPRVKASLRRRFPSFYRSVQLWVAARAITETGSPWARNVLNDESLSTIIRTCLSQGSVGVDVGAAAGRFTDEMRRSAPGGIIFGIEPIPAAAANLKRLFANHKNVVIMPLALGSEITSAQFWVCEADTGYSGLRPTEAAQQRGPLAPVTVDVVPLDATDIANTSVRLIKIDVEGGEYDVISGGRKTILRHHPIIAFECTRHTLDYEKTPEDLFDLLDDLGYQIQSPESFLSSGAIMSRMYFSESVLQGSEFFFIASPSGDRQIP